MARAGLRWNDGTALADAARLLAGASGWEGVFTHFHSSDTDPAATAVQWERFEDGARGAAVAPALVHAANSAAALAGTRYRRRPGAAGRSFSTAVPRGASRPSRWRALRARVVAIRRLPAGDPVSYGATWRAPWTDDDRDARHRVRATGCRARAPTVARSRLVRAERPAVPIVGRVTMDMTMIESGCRGGPGDVATLFGGLVTLDQQAEASGTIATSC